MPASFKLSNKLKYYKTYLSLLKFILNKIDSGLNLSLNLRVFAE